MRPAGPRTPTVSQHAWASGSGGSVAVMRAAIDAEGRVVVPEPILGRLGLVGPARLDSCTAHTLSAAWFPPPPVLEPVTDSAGSLDARMAVGGVSGGAAHGEDRRAESTYRKLGVAHRLLS